MPSENFERFKASYLGDERAAWHDGLDAAALRALAGAEREEAERLLLGRLEARDTRAFEGLSELGSAKGAARMKSLLPALRGARRLAALVALWRIERYAHAPRQVAELLRREPEWGERMAAARALREFGPEVEAVRALGEALEDENELVRCHAADSLLAARGLHEDPLKSHPLSLRLMRAEGEERRRSADEVRALAGV
jgi:hypothetical protein